MPVTGPWFIILFEGVYLAAVSLILALNVAALKLTYHGLIRFYGRSYWPERAREYETLEAVLFGGLSSAALYAALRVARRWCDDRRVLFACLGVSTAALAVVGAGLGFKHLAAGRWTALPVAATAALCGGLALRREVRP